MGAAHPGGHERSGPPAALGSLGPRMQCRAGASALQGQLTRFHKQSQLVPTTTRNGDADSAKA